jgi:hypothetical protein
MKKANILYLLTAILLTSSCSTDFLNTKSQTEIMAEDIWKEKSLAEAYMYDIYFAFQDAGFTEELQASACDEAMFTHGREFPETNAGAVTDVNLGWFSKTQSGHQWQRLYLNIRSCNDFIENLDNATFAEDARVQLKGEAYFLRAYFLHRLTRAFGGVPIQLRVTQLTDDPESFLIPRSSYTDCIKQVLSDIDNAAEYLKDRTFANTQKGRATLAAVKALRVRVLTDVASDLHDQPTASAKSSLLGSYAHPELLFYTEGSRTERWQAAKAAAKDLLDNPMGHAIPTYGGSGLSTEEKAQAIWKFFLTESADNIFSRYFIDTKDESGTKMPIFNGPSGYHAWGGNTPIQDLVDAYAMEDGSKFNWNDPQHATAPYSNREPRFYATIMYDGMQWIQRPSDFAAIEPTGKIQTGYYQLDPSITDDSKFFPGMDTRAGGGENWNATYTGYYLKKYINPADGDHRNKINAIFPFIRLSEIYFDYIEACIELGELDEAKKYLNEYRANVNLPAITTNDQNELRKIYLEFTYEEIRYWDVRRWMIAPELPGLNSLKGIRVTATLKPGIGARSKYDADPTVWDMHYKVIDLNNEGRQFVDKCYYLPMMRDECNSNPNLIQNPGYGE